MFAGMVLLCACAVAVAQTGVLNPLLKDVAQLEHDVASVALALAAPWPQLEEHPAAVLATAPKAVKQCKDVDIQPIKSMARANALYCSAATNAKDAECHLCFRKSGEMKCTSHPHTSIGMSGEACPVGSGWTTLPRDTMLSTTNYLGGGGFGKVYKAHVQPQDAMLTPSLRSLVNEEVALKVHGNVDGMNKADCLACIQVGGNRANIEQGLLGFVQVCHAWIEAIPGIHEGVCVMHMIDATTLEAPGKKIPAQKQKAAIYTMLKGLQALQNAGEYHRDNQLKNIMMKEDGTIVLIDYGSQPAYESFAAESAMFSVLANVLQKFDQPPQELFRFGKSNILPNKDEVQEYISTLSDRSPLNVDYWTAKVAEKLTVNWPGEVADYMEKYLCEGHSC